MDIFLKRCLICAVREKVPLEHAQPVLQGWSVAVGCVGAKVLELLQREISLRSLHDTKTKMRRPADPVRHVTHSPTH